MLFIIFCIWIRNISLEHWRTFFSRVQFYNYIHSVQRLITSDGARWRNWDNITVILKYFWQMAITWSEGINEFMKFVNKTFSFRKQIRYSFRTAKFCTEVFVMLKCLWPNLIYLTHPHTCLHSVWTFYRNNIAVLLLDDKNLLFLHLQLERGVVRCDIIVICQPC